MEITRYIKHNANWPQTLTLPPYNLTIAHFPPYYHLYYKNYPTNNIQWEANGLILNEEGEIVCYGYNKEISFEKLNKEGRRPHVTQFVDGFWFWVWNDGKRWHYSTPSHFDAYSHPITNQTSFGDYIDELCGATLTTYLPPTCTYMFQLVEDKVWYYGRRNMDTLDFERGVPYLGKNCAQVHIFSNGMWDPILFKHIEQASTTELGCTFWNDERYANVPYHYYKPRTLDVKEIVKKWYAGKEIKGFARLLYFELDTYLRTLDNMYQQLRALPNIRFNLILNKLNKPLNSIFKEAREEAASTMYEYYRNRQSQLILNANLKFYLY